MTTIAEIYRIDVLCNDKNGMLTLNNLTMDKKFNEVRCVIGKLFVLAIVLSIAFK
jgi:hypothetical protein